MRPLIFLSTSQLFPNVLIKHCSFLETVDETVQSCNQDNNRNIDISVDEDQKGQRKKIRIQIVILTYP
jgi:hypothetical protein